VPGEGLIVEEVSVTFGGLVALDGVSLQLSLPVTSFAESAPGEIVGIIGPNGAGKTTLFNVISGFVRPNAGRLRIDGEPLRRHRPHNLPKLGVARTLQGVGLFPGLTVLENVMAGATSHARAGLVACLLGLPRSARDEAALRARAERTLAELEISEWADALPAALPYGIQKRVSLARALADEPRLLLLDEPASGLSESDMADLGALIRSLRHRVSILLVEHHMDLVMSVCDRLLVLDFGRVLETGTPEEIKANPAVTRAYLGEDVSHDLVADFGPSPAATAGPGSEPGHA
jgi:branched-chain amino acid transport system ATP-binding protein